MVRSTFNNKSKGNVFALLFAAVAMTGVLGVVGMQTVSGPVRTITKVTQQNIAETDLMTNAKIVVLNGAVLGDSDSDNYIEPAQMRNDSTCGNKPTNGGCLPQDIGAIQTDPWGTPYGYCVWDHGTTTGAAGMLQGIADTSEPVIAIITAGPDRVFQTTCQDVTAAGVGGVIEAAGSDDLLKTETYTAAMAGAGGLWSIKGGDPDTAIIDKKLEVGNVGGAGGFSFDTISDTGSLPKIDVDWINSKTGASVQLATGLKLDNAYSACDAGNTGVIRYGSGTVEVCNGSSYVPLATAGDQWRIIDEDHGADTYITVAGTTNTNTNEIVMRTNGTDRVVIDSSGAVAIANNLGVSGNVGVGGNVTGVGTASFGDDLTVGTDKLVVDVSSGFVGINKANPTSELDVTGSGIFSGSLDVGTSITAGTTLDVGSSATIGTSALVGTNLTVNEDLTVDGDTLVVDSANDFVGINKTPTKALDVAGSGEVTGSFVAGSSITAGSYVALGDVGSGSCSPEGAIQYNGSSNRVEFCNTTWQPIDTPSGVDHLDDIGDVDVTGVTNGQTIVFDGTNWVAGNAGNASFADQSKKIIDDDGDTQIQVEETSDEDIIRFDTAGTQRMVIKDNGYVEIASRLGLGTTNPRESIDAQGNALFWDNGHQRKITIATDLNNNQTGTTGWLAFDTDSYGNTRASLSYNDGGKIRLTRGLPSSSNDIVIDASNGNIGFNTDTPNATALLDMTSTTLGFLAPRMTTAQRDAIASPATGLQVYNTTTNTHDYYNGTAWRSFATSASSAATVVDADNDTKIQVEETADDDTIRFDTAGTERMIITSAGIVRITGDIEYTGTLTDISDRRLKTDIHSLDQADLVDRLSRINTYSFKMKDDPEGRMEMGVMAQELEVIFPELVHTAPDEMGTKSVNYMGLIAPMIEATKALKAENDNLKADLAAIKADQTAVLAQMNALKTDVNGLEAQTGYGTRDASYANWMMVLLMGIIGSFITFTVVRRRV